MRNDDEDTHRLGLCGFLREAGIYDQTQAAAVKRVLACQLERNMKRAQLAKTSMAKRMGTTRAQIDRLLNPKTRR